MQNPRSIRLALSLIVGMSLLAIAPLQAQDAAATTVTCKDGSSSKGGKGACSHHGGINKGGDAAGSADTSTPATAGKAAATAAGPTSSNTAPASSNAMTRSSGAAAGDATTPASAGKSAATAASPTSSNTAPASSNSMTRSANTAPGDTSSPSSAGKAASTASATGASGQSGTPTAKCKDGTMSYSKHHTGSCSHHGGVAEFLDK